MEGFNVARLPYTKGEAVEKLKNSIENYMKAIVERIRDEKKRQAFETITGERRVVVQRQLRE